MPLHNYQNDQNKILTIPNTAVGMKLLNFYTLLVRQLNSSHWKTIWQFLIKFNIYLPYVPAILLLGNYPRE